MLLCVCVSLSLGLTFLVFEEPWKVVAFLISYSFFLPFVHSSSKKQKFSGTGEGSDRSEYLKRKWECFRTRSVGRSLSPVITFTHGGRLTSTAITVIPPLFCYLLEFCFSFFGWSLNFISVIRYYLGFLSGFKALIYSILTFLAELDLGLVISEHHYFVVVVVV